MQRPLCFVLMPFGRKPATGGGFIDFDAVYCDLIAPAIGKMMSPQWPGWPRIWGAWPTWKPVW